MKKLFCLVMAITIGITTFAQQEHMTFKNIPISGSLLSFIEKMKNAGFSMEYQADNGAVMKGSFAGFSDCEVIIACSQKSKTVWKVVVDLPSQSSWSAVQSRYNEYKEKYINKYGKPTDSFAFFSSPYYDGDGYELQAIKIDKGYFSTYWILGLGTIAVEIKASNSYEGNVRVGYEDKASTEIRDAELAAVVDDDI